jgi:hypothetical protein
VTADRRLRHAYRNAVRAGVPRPALVSYRNRWAELRRGAGRNPARTAQDYRKLEMALSRAARPKAAHLLPRPRNAPVAHRGGRRLARR